ncbi:hypothetical protein CRG98_035511 [Punica granatum]|uniref:Uncharacterized protein n=1 Tax=Punica granatum TaxID=22663 RepID=A0A2I0IJ92_PUNGR|nr:hypothetical protein CRG98_035511 [Punica granatum]
MEKPKQAKPLDCYLVSYLVSNITGILFNIPAQQICFNGSILTNITRELETTKEAESHRERASKRVGDERGYRADLYKFGEQKSPQENLTDKESLKESRRRERRRGVEVEQLETRAAERSHQEREQEEESETKRQATEKSWTGESKTRGERQRGAGLENRSRRR